MEKTKEEILGKHEDENEHHFHDCDKKWICEAMEEYGKQQRALGFEEGKKKTSASIINLLDEWLGLNFTNTPISIKLNAIQKIKDLRNDEG